LDYILPGKPLI